MYYLDLKVIIRTAMLLLHVANVITARVLQMLRIIAGHFIEQGLSLRLSLRNGYLTLSDCGMVI